MIKNEILRIDTTDILILEKKQKNLNIICNRYVKTYPEKNIKNCIQYRFLSYNTNLFSEF